ncbi:MAG: hypothetical protein HZB38_18345 [Planctomycetes bacterium]|nr:hypothetical protein [Planctomycetota bacterium]
MRGLFDFLRVADLPRMARPTFVAEWRHMALFGIFAGMIEGNTSAIVVAKTFHADTILIPVVNATPMLANLLSLLWGALLRDRPRQAMFLLLAPCAVASFAAVGLIPAGGGSAAGWVFAGLLACSRIFLTGLINLRTSMWGVNYPTAYRARITGRLQSLRFLMGLMATAGVAQLFDHDAQWYRWIYPLVGLVGFASLLPIRRLRVRGEAAEFAQRREGGGPERRGFLASLRECREILRRDRAFARYCTAQYFLGSSNFMIDPVLAIVATSRLNLDYFKASGLLDLLPNVVMLATIPLWSRQFDRVGVLRFRVTNSAIWVGSACLGAVGLLVLAQPGFLWLALACIWMSRILNGMGRGGGAIAWNLGHLHFSRREDADLYMAIHVGLTGVRGLIMPFIAWFLYEQVGDSVLVVAVLLAATAFELFRRLARPAPAAATAPQAPIH